MIYPQYKSRCEDCFYMIEKNGQWCCKECFGQKCSDIDDCPCGLNAEDVQKAQDVKAPKHYEQSKPTEKRVRERKVDDTKKQILQAIKGTLDELGAEVTLIKTETEIKFNYEGGSYTVKLTKHRPPKK